MLSGEQVEKEIENLKEVIQEKQEKDRLLLMYKGVNGPEEVVPNDVYIDAQKKLRGNTKILKLMSGFKGLDQMTEGFWEGNVVVISGPTKEGKTTFCQSLTINFAAKGIGILWFPFDTPGEELIERFTTPVRFYLPRRNKNQKTLEWIEQKIIEGIAKYNIRTVFIDHLGMLTRFTNSKDNRSTELQSIMAELKEIAMKWRVIIFINHHIRRRIGGDDSPPTLDDLKDSSGIASDADTVLFVWRMKKKTPFGFDYADDSMLSLQAHRRRGARGFMKLKHEGDHFTEADPTGKSVITSISQSLAS